MVYIVLYDAWDENAVEFYAIIGIPTVHFKEKDIQDLVDAEYNGCRWARVPFLTAQVTTKITIAKE